MNKKDFEDVMFVLVEVGMFILVLAGAAVMVAIAVSIWKGGAA